MNTPSRLSAVDLLERWLLPAAVVAALIFGIVGIGRFLRLDEANSVIIASSNFGRLLEYLRNDNNLPFYYLLLHGWIRLAGISEWAVHLPSVIFYLLAIGVVYQLGWEMSQKKEAAIYSAFFYLVSSQAVYQAQKTRMYSLLGLVAGLSTLFLFRVWWRDKTRKRDWAFYVLINAVGTFVHVWYFFLLLAQALCGLIFQPKKLRSLAAAQFLAVVPFLVLWARYLPRQASIGAVDWMPHVRASFFVSVFGEFYGGERWGLLFLLAVAGMCVAGAWKSERQVLLELRPVAALVTIALVCMIVPLLVSFVRPIYWPGRYTMIALPAFATAIGCAVAAWANPTLRAAFAYGVLIIAIAVHIRTRNEVFENSVNVYRESESDKAATLQLCQQAGPRDTLVFTGLTRAGVEYYLRRLGCGRGLNLVSLPTDTAEHLGWVRPAKPEELAKEAHHLARQPSEQGDGDRKLWLILGHGVNAKLGVVTEVFDRDLGDGRVQSLRGSQFDQVVVYPYPGVTRSSASPSPQ
jgi:hypothetical protein